MRIHPMLISLLCVVAAAAGGQAQPSPTRPGNEREIRFSGVGGAKLVGSLMLPAQAGAKKFPAVLIISGSGPTDRDGNQRPMLITDLQKQIATALAEKGIASLRFDKRGIAQSAAGAPRDLAGMTDFFQWDNFAGDVDRAFYELQKQPDIDPKRCAIVGHSEGAMLALVAADSLRAQPDPPRALVLLGAPGRTIDAVIHDQLSALLDLQKATPQIKQRFLDKNRQIIESIRESGTIPPDVPTGLAALYPQYLRKFYVQELKVDPAALAARFRGPVLVMQGEFDRNVSPQRDGKTLDDALASRPKEKGNEHELVIIKSASHCLKPVEKPTDAGFAGPADPQAMTTIARFLDESLRGE